MKKTGIKKNWLGIIICGGLLFSLLVSCDNFLNAGKIKDEIEYAIYVSNNECPVAKVEEPVFSDAGVAKNTAIRISFTMPMDTQSFYENYQIVDYGGESLAANFREPVWSNNNTLVTIYANQDNLIDMRGKKKMDLYFILSKECKTPTNLPIKNAINHKYRINDEKENIPPDISPDTYAEKPEFVFAEQVISPASPLLEGSINEENEEKIINANHINNTLTLYIEGNDANDGLVFGHVTVKRIKDVNGNDVSKTETLNDFVYTDLTMPDGSDYYSSTVNLDLSPMEYVDGLYEIKVYVQDMSGTDSEDCKTYYVIKDTSFEFSVSPRVIFETPKFRADMTPGFDNFEKDNPNMIPNPDYDENDSVNHPEKIRYDAYSEIRQPNRELTPEEEADDNVHRRWYWGPETKDDFEREYCEFHKQSASPQKLDEFKKRIYFDTILDDPFYKSYKDEHDYFSYFISWGLSIDNLTRPVRITGDKESDSLKTQCPNAVFLYELPADFINYLNDNVNNDVVFAITVLDSVGNQRVIYELVPKQVEFYGYKVEDDVGENKKKITLNFSESINNQVSAYTAIPDRLVTSRYRIFYAKKDNTTLIRNTAVPFEQDKGDELSDKNVITGLDSNTEYDVYIVQRYDMTSLTNGMWCSCTYSNALKVTVNTAGPGEASIQTPEFTIISKESAGLNTGLFKITVKINDDKFNNNKGITGIKYIPCFKPDKIFNDDRILEEGNWTYSEAQDGQTSQTITFTVKNPLRAPIGKGEAWDRKWDEENNKWTNRDWEGLIDEDGNFHENYSYTEAVAVCGKRFGYPAVSAWIKLIATDGSNSEESSELEIQFNENDDNIPPKISKDVSLHDGKLSFDGHSFEYESIITENEGHLAEYFNYYYEPYNPAWGDSLPQATAAIENLPGGMATYTSDTWFDDRRGADYRLPLAIPVYGLEDGEYMFYAKVSDTFGNYTYVTLGKANVATFKNKLKVELVRDTSAYTPTENLSEDAKNALLWENEGKDPDNLPAIKRHFRSTLDLDAGEMTFNRNMINIQEFANYKDEYTKKDVQGWYNYYGGMNELQECERVDGKLCNYNPGQYIGVYPPYNDSFDPKAIYFVDDSKDRDAQGLYPLLAPRNLFPAHWFRLTVQSFNENYISEERPDGVDRIYGRPYNYIWNKDTNEWEPWTRDVLYYVDGETKYDVCTQETVSNTVYFYTPGEWIDDQGNLHFDDFSDIKSSFFPEFAKPYSNYDYLVNIIASARDLGRDPDEWERRGKLIQTHWYKKWMAELSEAEKETREDYKAEEDQTACPFDINTARDDMAASNEKGLVYYAVVVHFANGDSAVSDTFTMYGF